MDQPATQEYSPMRAGLFERWLKVWHAIYIGGLLVALGIALWQARGAWGGPELALTVIVIALVALYLWFIVFWQDWPHPLLHLIIYYVVCLGLFALAIRINPIFLYALGMLTGQMFGILPPVAAVPGVVAVFALIILGANDWRLPGDIGWEVVVAVVLQIGIILLLYLYIYHLIRTSQERALLVNELQAAQARLEQAREQEKELAVLRERERLARDLHDGLGHALATLSLQLEAVQRLYPVDAARASAQIDEMKHLTRDSMASLRRAIEGLRAPGLGERPLRQALQELCLSFGQRTGATVTCEITEAVDALRPVVAETIYRVTQEALTNAEKHAGASRVDVRLNVNSSAVLLTIRDDGVGLPDDAENLPGHYGLRGMRERVEGLGGSLALGNEDAGGTTVTAVLPLAAPLAQSAPEVG